MNRVSSRIGVIVIAAAALSVLFVSLMGGAALGAPSIGKNGVIHSCFKAKGKDKGVLRVVPSNRSCRKLRGGWRPLSWTVSGSSGASSQPGPQGAGGDSGQPGPQGVPGPEGKQGTASQVEKSLVETVETQTSEINGLTQQVSDLTDEVLSLEGDVGGLSGGLADLEGDVGGLSGELVNLEGNVGDLTGELVDLEGAVGNLAGGLTGLEGEVTGLGSELADLEGTVGETCSQLKTVTNQSNEIVEGVAGASLNGVLKGLGGAIGFPGLPGTLEAFECK